MLEKLQTRSGEESYPEKKRTNHDCRGAHRVGCGAAITPPTQATTEPKRAGILHVAPPGMTKRSGNFGEGPGQSGAAPIR